MRPYIQSSCGHSWIQCPLCAWNKSIDWQKKERLVAILTAGGSMPVDSFIKEEIEKNDRKRKMAFGMAYGHIRDCH